MKLYYLGPKGTLSYLAAKQYKSESEMDFEAKSNLYEVIQAASNDDNSIAVYQLRIQLKGRLILSQMH